MKREDLGVLSREEQAHEIRDADRMAWLDGHRAYFEIGRTSDPRGGFISFDGEAWQVYVKLSDAEAHHRVDSACSFREAVDALMKALS